VDSKGPTSKVREETEGRKGWEMVREVKGEGREREEREGKKHPRPGLGK